jgi:CBS domain-containing protein
MGERTLTQFMSQRQIISVSPQATVWEAACVMSKANCGSVLIINMDGVLQGILTERDLMTRVLAKALDGQKTSVSDVMTRNPHCVPPEMTVSRAVLIMIERGFRHLPIVSSNGKILGVFSARDALPREMSNAINLADFHDQVNDALG